MATASASPFRVRRLSAPLSAALAAAAAVVAVAVCLPVACASRQSTCSEASRAYGRIGFSPIDVPQHALLADNSKICAPGLTCCTSPMEANLTRKARQWFDQRLVRVTQPSRDTLVTRTVKLNDFFLQLIQRAQDDLHDMFVKAYGLQYIANVGVFRELFQNLRRFFQPGAEANVPEAVRRFFMDIFARMFAMLNPEHSFDEAYMLCVAAQVGTLRPFGDIPDTLVRNVKQAFIAAKMFVQGLAVGRDVALKAPTVEPNADCFRALTRLLYCQQCRVDDKPSGAPTGASAASEPRPCQEYCVNVARGCLAQHYELSDSWDRYLDAMDELGTRIEGPGAFNIEAILSPLKDLISTAIMEYHDNNRDITQKIFMSKGCGTPKTARQPRSPSAANGGAANDATSRAARSSRLSLPAARSNNRQQQQQHQSPAITLDRLVRDARARLKQLRGMWRTAPDQLCTDGDVMAQPNSARCWNGFDVARYLVRPAGEGLAAGASNPEVRLNPSVVTEQRQTVVNLTEQLKLITSRIKDAMQGIDVDWLVLDVGRRDESAKSDDSSSRLLLDGSDIDGDDDGDADAGSGSSSSSSRGVPVTPSAARRVGRPSTSGGRVDGSGGGVGSSSDDDDAVRPAWWTAGSSDRRLPSEGGDVGSGHGRLPLPLPTKQLGRGRDDEDVGSGSGDGRTGGTGSRRGQSDSSGSGSATSSRKGPAADMPRLQHQPVHATAASGSGAGSTVVASDRRTSQGNYRAAARSGSSQATVAGGHLATAFAAALLLLLPM